MENEEQYLGTRDVRENFVSPTNPTKVIRLKCLDCCCGSSYEVEKCGVSMCPLHPWRFGKNPYRKKVSMSEERKKHLSERLNMARLKK